MGTAEPTAVTVTVATTGMTPPRPVTATAPQSATPRSTIQPTHKTACVLQGGAIPTTSVCSLAKTSTTPPDPTTTEGASVRITTAGTVSSYSASARHPTLK